MLLPGAVAPAADRSASCRISRASHAAHGPRPPTAADIAPDRSARRSGRRSCGAIGDCRLLLSEAMHGVIVADAMRVPWIAMRPLVSVHRAKWLDWADTLDLRVRFQRLAASSLAERLHASSLAATRRGRRLLNLARPASASRRAVPVHRTGRAVAHGRGCLRATTLRCGGTGPLPHTDAGAAGRAATRSVAARRKVAFYLASSRQFRVPR